MAHELNKPPAPWGCTGCDWQPRLGESIRRSFDRHLIKVGEKAQVTVDNFMEVLTRRDVITTDPADAEQCCGQPRDDDGFCRYRPGHPIYLNPTGF